MFVRKCSSSSSFLLYIFILNLFIKDVSSSSIYNIGNLNEFINFTKAVNGKTTFSGTTVYLTNDIDFNSYSSTFEPIGKFSSVYCFSGTFNGQGHTIMNLAVNLPAFEYAALFGYSNGLTIMNVVIDKSCSFSNDYFSANSDAYVSSIIGECQGTCNIENVVNMADISYCGSKSMSYAIIGGIVAKCSINCILSNCVNFGSVTISSSNTVSNIHAGGIAGETCYFASVENCINYGMITNSIQASSVYMGGIAGIIHSDIAIENCLSTGPLSSVEATKNTYEGSFVGSAKSYSKNNTINNCFWTEIVGNHNASGEIIDDETILNIIGIESIEVNESLFDVINNIIPSSTSDLVIVHLNGGRIGNSSYDNLIVNKVMNSIPEPVREGSTFKFWCTDTGCSATCDSNETDKCDSKELYAVWDRANVMFLTFDDNNSTINRTFSFGDVIEYPEGVEKTGHTLSGWDNTTATAPGYDIVVSAIWSINNYTVTFDFDNGTEPEERMFVYNTVIIYPDDPIKEGHSFINWNDTSITTIPAHNLTIKALWIANNYTVTFDFDNGTEAEERTFAYNTVIEYPEDPTKEGYSFIDWNDTSITAMSAHNLTIKALWIANSYTVTFNTTGGTATSPLKREVTYGEQYGELPETTRTGYTLAGWFTEENGNGESIDFDTNITVSNNHTLYACWNINNYTVTFDFNNGTEPEERTLTYNTEVIYPDNPTKEGHSFINWNDTSITTMPAYNLTIKALWVANNYTVTFVFDNGTEPEEKIFTYNTVIEYPEDPTKEGHSFINWNDTSISIMPAHNLTIKALWIASNYTVIFDFDNGTDAEERTFAYNTVIDFPEDPTKEGHIFFGWDNNITVMPAHNLIITAKWVNVTSPSSIISITLNTVDLSDDKIEEIINKYTDSEFEIVEISRNDNNELIVIVKFKDVEEASEFVKTTYSSIEKDTLLIKTISFVDNAKKSFSFYAIPLLSILFM